MPRINLSLHKSIVGDLVVDVNEDIEKLKRFNPCTYCGITYGNTRDHIIPVSWEGKKRSYNKKDVVPCCSECNSTLGAAPIFNIPERAMYLYEKYKKKYNKLLAMPNWKDSDFKDMDEKLVKSIKASMFEKSLITLRLDYLFKAFDLDNATEAVRQVTIQDARCIQVYNMLYKGETIPYIMGKTGFLSQDIVDICYDDAYYAVRVDFLMKKELPFDTDLIEYNQENKFNKRKKRKSP